jgi:hypothetical protein
MKEKTCKICRVKFAPSRPMQVVCSPQCAGAYAWREKTKAEVVAAREDRKSVRLRKEAIKTRRDWIKEAQIAFNAYIRERDRGRPCICCGKPLAGGQDGTGGLYDCGHYRSVGSAPHLRFDERNAHGQRKQCNRYGAGRAVDYRIGLIEKIGQSEVDALEADNDPRKWKIEDLKQIIFTYKQKLKELNGG